MKNQKPYVIIAPHADDEIIGCYEVLMTGLVTSVYYPPQVDLKECEISANLFGFNVELLDLAVVQNLFIDKVLFAPDPNYDYHPEHRRWGHYAESLIRNVGIEVVFYNTNMNAPYIREVKNEFGKKEALNTCYSRKRDLWRYDHRYYLFEGQCKWMNYG